MPASSAVRTPVGVIPDWYATQIVYSLVVIGLSEQSVIKTSPECRCLCLTFVLIWPLRWPDDTTMQEVINDLRTVMPPQFESAVLLQVWPSSA